LIDAVSISAKPTVLLQGRVLKNKKHNIDHLEGNAYAAYCL